SDPLDPTLPAFADSSLLVLEMTESELYDGCMEQCASPESWVGYCERTSLWNDDDIGSLSRVDVAAGFSTAAGGTGAENAIVIWGTAFSEDTMMTSRLIHLRRHYDQGGLW